MFSQIYTTRKAKPVTVNISRFNSFLLIHKLFNYWNVPLRLGCSEICDNVDWTTKEVSHTSRLLLIEWNKNRSMCMAYFLIFINRNQSWRTCRHLNTIIKLEFLCIIIRFKTNNFYMGLFRKKLIKCINRTLRDTTKPLYSIGLL